MSADVQMTEDAEEFHLSSVLEATKQDIKGVQVTSGNEIIVAGRDETIKFFAKRRGEFAMYKDIVQPQGLFVNSLALFEHDGEWLLFAGRKNGSIVVYNNNFAEVTVLTHHTSNVCCLYVDKVNKKLLSGSWDNNVIIWPIDKLTTSEQFSAFMLSGHTMSVWALATFANRPGVSLSASADKTIKLWEQDNCIRTYKGHTDVIRCLQILSNETFVSAANDSTYRIWHVDSEQALAVFPSQLEDFIFSLSLVGAHLISCGETGFIEVWKVDRTDGGENLTHKQVLRTPSATLWNSCTVSETDFAVASSDGRVYMYSSDPEKKASDDVLHSMDELMSEKMAAEIVRKEQESSEEIVIKVALDDGHPNLELRYKKGSDPAIAAENFIKANGLPISYLNEITNYIVANIPEARQAQTRNFKKQATQKVTVEGEQYDFAMDITLDNKQLKLPFNMGEDPHVVAWRFCERHNIPIKYAPKFAEIVKRDLEGVGSRTAGDFHDPFTGGGRYVPGQTSNGPAGGADPFTGGGRYVPGSSTSSFSSGGGDPFTSGGRYIPGSADAKLVPNASRPTDKLRPRCELVPMTNYHLFGVEGTSQKAVIKLKETNEHQNGCKLNEEQLSAMEKLLGSQPGSIVVGDVEKSALELGLMWPFADIQIIVDLLRCALLHQDLNKYFCDLSQHGKTTRARLFEILVSNPPVPVKVFTCRAIANSFAHADGREMVVADFTDFSQLVAQVVACFTVDSSLGGAKQLQVAAASALANWSLLLLDRSQKVAELGPREDVLRAIVAGLEPVCSFGDKDPTALVRLLQAIVTLMWGDKQVIQTAKNRNIVSIVNKLKDAVTDEIAKNVARCIVEMTFA